MITIITQMALCLLVALAIGFIFGWVLSSFLRNEKLENTAEELHGKLDQKEAELSEIQNELEAKNEDLEITQESLNAKEKELLIKSMDIEEYQKKLTDYESELKQTLSQNDSIKAEIGIYKEQIKEYQVYENENEILQTELKELENEKGTLLEKLDDFDMIKSDLLNANDKINASADRMKELEDQITTSQSEILTLKNQIKTKTTPQENKTPIDDDICTKDTVLDNKKIASFGFEDIAIVKLIKETFDKVKNKDN